MKHIIEKKTLDIVAKVITLATHTQIPFFEVNNLLLSLQNLPVYEEKPEVKEPEAK